MLQRAKSEIGRATGYQVLDIRNDLPGSFLRTPVWSMNRQPTHGAWLRSSRIRRAMLIASRRATA